MTKKELEQFDKMGVKSGLYDACVEVDDIKTFISQIKANQRKNIIAKIKTLQSANTENNMLSVKERLYMNEAFEEVLEKLKTNN